MLPAMRLGPRVLFLCVAGMVCEGLDLQSAGVAAAGIVQELRPGPSVLGWFFAASTVGLFIGAPIGGWFGDRLGRGRVVVASMVVFGVCSLATGLATSVGTLIAARFLTGLGLGGAMPNFIALASESSAVGKGGRSVALMFAGTPLGGAAASLVAAAVGPAHWRWVFVAGGLLPLAVAALWQSSRIDSPATQAAASGASSARPSMVDVAVADGRAVPSLLLWTASFASLLLLYLLLNWLPLLLVGMGLPPARAALAQVTFNLLGALGAIVVGTRLDGSSRTWAVAAAFGALVASLFVLARVDVGWVVPLVGAVGFAVMAAQATIFALGPACYPSAVRGTGVGMAIGAGRLGSITGPILAASLLGAGQSAAGVLTSIAPIAAVAAICAVALSATLHRRV
jgi:MFS transporter, AAHS family, 3-hydroxyphenylpropionic acid transporter